MSDDEANGTAVLELTNGNVGIERGSHRVQINPSSADKVLQIS
jgi:hypothetical protein